MNAATLQVYAKAGDPAPAHGTAAGTWYRIKAELDDAEKTTSIEVHIYDEIGGWGISAAAFLRDLRAVDDGVSPILVAFNSPGGDLFDGVAINGALARLGSRCTSRIDGLAASAASVAAVGASTVVIAQGAMMMIHNPWVMTWGEADDLRKTAEMLDKARDGLIAAYRRKALALDEDELKRMLDDETWFTAEEAVALGLADVIEEGVAIQACRSATGILARYRKAPESLKASMLAHNPGNKPTSGTSKAAAVVDTPAPAGPSAADLAARIARACGDAGMSELSEVLIMSTKLKDGVAVDAEIERAKAVRDLCVTAKLPELAADYVKAGLSVDSVRARLFDRLIMAGSDEINNKPPGDPGGAKKGKSRASVKTSRSGDIYANRRSTLTQADQSQVGTKK